MEQQTLPLMIDQAEDTMNQIRGLVQQLKSLKDSEKDLEVELEKTRGFINQITDQFLPDLFAQTDMRSFESSDGMRVELTEFYVGSDKDPRAVDWIVDNGFDSIIKNTLTVKFDRGDNGSANELAEELRTKGLGFELKEAIHHATLKSFINEQCVQNPDFPRDLFKVHQIRRVVTK